MREGLDALEARTKRFTVSGIKLCEKLLAFPALRTALHQLSDATGSVGSNHRAMRRARSNREFYAKLCVVCEEIDESVFWLEVLEETCTPLLELIAPLLREARELRAIFAKARKTCRDGS